MRNHVIKEDIIMEDSTMEDITMEDRVADTTEPSDHAYPQGLFSWADVSVPDPVAGAEFYRSLFGWQSEDQHDPEGEYLYTMFTRDGKDVAGLGQLPEAMAAAGVPPSWNSYITVDDLDRAIASVGANGGTVIDSMEVMTAGRMAIITDPTGAAAMLWQAGEHKGAGAFTGHGAMSWNELATRDVPKAQAFYKELVDWRYEDSPGPFEYQLIMMDTKLDEQPYMFDTFNGGMLAMDDTWPAEMPAHWMVYFTVDNTDEAVAKVLELGGAAAVEPFDSENGRISVIRDPQGAVFSVIAPSQAVKPDQG